MTEQPVYVRGAYFLLFIGLVLLCLYYGQPLLVPVIMALLFAFLVLPISNKLESWKTPRWLASFMGVLTVFAFIGALFMFLSWEVMSFADDFPSMKSAVDAKMKTIYKYVEINYSISRREQSRWVLAKRQELIDSGANSAMGIFSATGAVIASMLLIPIFMFFMLMYREKFKTFIHLLNPEKHDHVMEIVRKISRISQKYIRGIFIDIVILTALNSIGFLVLGLKYAILLGLIAAVLNIIPYVGVLIGSLLPIGMALVTKDSVMYAVGALGVCVLVQFLDNNFITPKVVGSSVNLNPLASIGALLFGGLLWGLPGMVLAIPLAGMFKVVCDNVAELRPFGFLLGEEQEYKPFRFKRISLPGMKKSSSGVK